MPDPVSRVGLFARLLLVGGSVGACAGLAPGARPADATVDALTGALARAPVAILGEVHDNAAQHALRAAALRRLVAAGARPALAFEQFDRESQAEIDRIRADPEAGDVQARADRLIARVGARGWDWRLYRPYLVLALEYELPIVAANLSRKDAMRIAREGVAVVFDPARRAALGLDAIDPQVEAAQEEEIAEGHCHKLPREALAPMALAQMARDAVLAEAIAPFAGRGVVLLTGNGHARRDIGVPLHLAPAVRAHLVAIGLLEDDALAGELAAHFDVALLTVVQERKDPCAEIGPPPRGAAGVTRSTSSP